MLSRSDRRQTERFDLEIPLSIRTLELPETLARMAVSTNISATGLCVATDLSLRVGTRVEISIRMPQHVSGQPSREWCCKGRVVRVEHDDCARERQWVGVEFHYYEILKGGGGARFQISPSGGQNE
ncbi:MAG: PilZ domain-containing protein [Candidatus Acidiferrales bacterium]